MLLKHLSAIRSARINWDERGIITIIEKQTLSTNIVDLFND